MNARRGLSLMELLACIAIVAVVAAVATPVFASAKRSALERQSVYDMKQIAMAALL